MGPRTCNCKRIFRKNYSQDITECDFGVWLGPRLFLECGVGAFDQVLRLIGSAVTRYGVTGCANQSPHNLLNRTEIDL